MRTVIVGDEVVTGDGVVADAVVVSDGVVEAVGRAADIADADAQRVDWSGHTILPALRDAHVHPIGLAQKRQGLDLSSVQSSTELSEAILTHAAGTPPTSAIVGLGLDDTWNDGRMPDRADLDRLASVRPMLLYRHCSHIAAVNSAALAEAGIDRATPDPTGGQIDRDDDGHPTGVLRETAIGLATRALADLSPAVTSGDVGETLRYLRNIGLSDVHAIVSVDADSWCGPGGELDLLFDGAVADGPHLRVFVIAGTVEALRSSAARITDSGMVFAGWKGFADGSFGGHTASLAQPYTDQPDNWGIDRWDRTFMTTMATAALDLGGQVAIHAIGDRAVDDAVSLASRFGSDAARFRVEHASLLTPPLIESMADLGVTASIQPPFVPADAVWLVARLGAERAACAYPFRSLLAAGVTVVAGSDAPIEDPDPFAGMRAAVGRGGFHTEEALEPLAALGVYAITAIEPGSPANLTKVSGPWWDPTSVDIVSF